MGGEYKLLSESQNETFDAEYHSPGEIDEKVARILASFPGGEVSVLDIGGGNGKFLDEILLRLPKANGVLLDVSSVLLSKNSLSDRKELIHGSVEDLIDLAGDRRFDVVTINWVLHHLVGDDYKSSVENAINTLRTAAQVLARGGVVIVSENMVDGYVGADVPSKVIFFITSQRNGLFVKVMRPFFNTAGVGVCFHSELGWRDIFARSGMNIQSEFKWAFWRKSLAKKILYPALVLKSERHGHFWLIPET